MHAATGTQGATPAASCAVLRPPYAAIAGKWCVAAGGSCVAGAAGAGARAAGSRAEGSRAAAAARGARLPLLSR